MFGEYANRRDFALCSDKVCDRRDSDSGGGGGGNGDRLLCKN